VEAAGGRPGGRARWGRAPGRTPPGGRVPQGARPWL